MIQIPRKRDYKPNWQVGDEAEWNWYDPQYVDTLHPVKIISIDWDTNTAMVKLMAFDDAEPHLSADLEDLHPFRAPEPNYPYVVGDKVHFRMWKRKVNGRKVDGYAGDEEGIWVKGIIVELNPDERYEICVKHYNWDSKKKETAYIFHWVVRRDVRLAVY